MMSKTEEKFDIQKQYRGKVVSVGKNLRGQLQIILDVRKSGGEVVNLYYDVESDFDLIPFQLGLAGQDVRYVHKSRRTESTSLTDDEVYRTDVHSLEVKSGPLKGKSYTIFSGTQRVS